MELTYSWKLTGLKKTNDPKIGLEGIIVQTYWECTGTNEDGHAGVFSGATPFNPEQIDPDNFTTYDQLTEQQVLGWIQSEVENSPGYQQMINKTIIRQIEAKNIQEVNPGHFPWDENAENTTEQEDNGDL
jgi:hypothetical protein